MQYYNAGDLFHFISNRSLSEHTVSVMAGRILHAIRYIHERRMVLRNIELEHILLSGAGDCPDAFLSNVGLAAYFDPRKPFTTPVGALRYSAPELIRKDRPCSYGPAVDMWAFGVCFYAMFTSAMPFPDPDESPQDFYSAVIEGRWNEELMIEKGCSPSARVLVEMLLTVDPQERLTAEQARRHIFFDETGAPWIRRKAKPDVPDLAESHDTDDEWGSDVEGR